MKINSLPKNKRKIFHKTIKNSSKIFQEKDLGLLNEQWIVTFD